MAGDREPGRHGLEDGGVRLDQAQLEGEEAEGEGVGQRDPLVVGRPLEGVHVREEARRDPRLDGFDEFQRTLEGGLGPAAECLEERSRLQLELPVGHHPCGEFLGRAPPGLEALHPLAAEPAGPECLVAVDAGQGPHGGHPAGPDQHAAEVEEDEVDPVSVTAAMLRVARTGVEYTLFCGGWAKERTAAGTTSRSRTEEEEDRVKLSMTLNYAGGFAESAKQAVELEKVGLDVVWVAEAYSFDAPSFMGFLAAKTERLEIGSAILPIYSRTPTLIAMTAAGVDAVSGGRCILGLGASGPQVIEGFHGVPYDRPLGRTREIIEICRDVWAREAPLTHDGASYHIPLPAGEGTGLGKALKLINHPCAPASRSGSPRWVRRTSP